MRVVLLDAVETGRDVGLVRALTGHLAAYREFDQLIGVSWPEGSGDASRPGAVERLAEQFRLADAIVTLPWTTLQPPGRIGSAWPDRVAEVCEGVARAGVPALVFGSSSLGYGPTLTGGPVDESWPMTGLRNVTASAALARADEVVGDFEREHPVVRVVRLRPPLVVHAALLVGRGPGGRRPRGPGTVAVVELADLWEAYRLALTGSISGPVNLGGRPVPVARLAGAAHTGGRRRWWPLSLGRANRGVAAAWLVVGGRSPAVDSTRAERELGWRPLRTTELAGSGHTPADHPDVAEPVDTDEREAVTVDPDAPLLYEKGLAYFDACVEGVTDDGWETFAWPRVQVRQMVALSARDQYLFALRLEGKSEEEAEAELPADPLGVDPGDGWQLAAERARPALRGPAGVHAPASTPYAGMLRRAAFDLTERGWSVARATDQHPPLDGDLVEIARARAIEVGALDNRSGDLSVSELFAAVLAAIPPVPMRPAKDRETRQLATRGRSEP